MVLVEIARWDCVLVCLQWFAADGWGCTHVSPGQMGSFRNLCHSHFNYVPNRPALGDGTDLIT
jgi:hypothetical protein